MKRTPVSQQRGRRGGVTSETSRIGRAPCPVRTEGMRRIVELCDARPMQLQHIATELKLPHNTIRDWLKRMGMDGRLVNPGRGRSLWMTPRLQTATANGDPHAAANATTPLHTQAVVTVPAQPQWLMPAAEVTYTEGVRITRQAAPRGRYEATSDDLGPHGGVISQDHAARRAAERAAARMAARHGTARGVQASA